MNLRFRVLDANAGVREFEFDRERVTIGRGPLNDVVVDDEMVGRRQGELRVDAGGVHWRNEPCGIPTSLVRAGRPLVQSDGDEECLWDVQSGDVVILGDRQKKVSIEILDTEGTQNPQPAFVPFRLTAPTEDEAAILLETASALASTLAPRPLLEGAARLLSTRKLPACDATFVLFSGPDEYHNDTFVIGRDGRCGPAPDPLAVISGALTTMRSRWANDERSVAAVGSVIVIPFGDEAVDAALVLRTPNPTPAMLQYSATIASWLEPSIRMYVKHRVLAREHDAVVEENRYLRSRQRQHYLFKELVCNSDAMRVVHHELQKYLDDDRPVLMAGEAGTGKELLARVLHHSGSRADQMIIRVSCAEYADERANFELFGCAPQEDEALDDAPRKGVFELVRGGTVFLEEIDLLPTMVQAKLVRTLKEGEVRRAGESVGRPIRSRLIASTHRDLAESVSSGRLRRDLYLLLKDQTITVPPLRARGDDILPLAKNFLAVFCARYGLETATITPGAAEALREYSWPGNVRELQARIESAVLNMKFNQVTAESLGL